MKTSLRQTIVVALVAASVAAVRVTLSAHHSFASFDITTERTITGTVSRFDWTNPHSWIWIDVPNDKGGVDSWGVEGMSPNYLARRGWTRTTVKPGDKITIVIRPLKNGQNGGMFVSAKMADGRLLRQTGESTNP